jgi:hypothetical protein
MAMLYETAPQIYQKALEYFNYFFTFVFAFEAILKMIAFGPRYFVNNWNKFDFFVVLSSILDIFINLLNTINSKFLRVGP